MSFVEAEMAALEISNRVDDLLAALPVHAPSIARQSLRDACDALRKAADAFADAAEAR